MKVERSADTAGIEMTMKSGTGLTQGFDMLHPKNSPPFTPYLPPHRLAALARYKGDVLEQLLPVQLTNLRHICQWSSEESLYDRPIE